MSFDEEWYLSEYPDVSALVSAGRFASGEQHYDTIGWRQMKDPCEGFDTSFYLLDHPDVRAAGINPFDHYLAWGETAGYEPDFDPKYYLTTNPDVAVMHIPPMMHYIHIGEAEGRLPVNPAEILYDESNYLISNVADFASNEVAVLGIQTDQFLNFMV